MLSGWKQIANELGVTVKTAKGYWKKYGMPIMRLPGGKPIIWDALLQEWLLEMHDKNIKARFTSVTSK